MLSHTEENYLKALYQLTNRSAEKEGAGTNEVAAYLDVKPATAYDMLKRLKEKGLVSYKKYGKNSLTEKGEQYAVNVIRKHRLWETFLHDKMGFSWDEVHEVAEQLEHIKSKKLIEKLDHFLGYPKVDPHGDPIPNEKGEIEHLKRKTLSEMPENAECLLVAVKDSSATFLQYAAKLGISLNSTIKVITKYEFDDSLEIEVNGQRTTISHKFANNLFVN